MTKLESFVEALKKIYVSAPISYGILALVALVYPKGWIFLFSVFLSFVLSDLLLNCFIHGGEGYAKLFTDNNFANKGYAYLVYLVGIVIGTVLSSIFADHLMAYLQVILQWYQAVLITDLIALGAVVADLQWRFYDKK
jgi:hypothetical protein